MENGMDIFNDVIKRQSYDVLDLLLRIWADVLPQNCLSRRVWYRANKQLAYSSLTERQQYLLRKVVSYVDDEPGMQIELVRLHEAVRRGWDVEDAIDNLVDSSSINNFDITGCAPLHIAVMHSHVGAVQQLIDADADVNVKDLDGMTPLMLAAQRNQIDCMRGLVFGKCQMMKHAKNGRTALHFAARDACAGAVELLLQLGGLVTARDLWGRTPLHVMAYSGADEAAIKLTAELLLTKDGVEIDAPDYSGHTPALLAIKFNNLPLFRCLAEAGASLKSVRWQRGNLLHLAAGFCTAEMLQFLENIQPSDIDPDLRNTHGDTPWDVFLFCTSAKPSQLGFYRKPTLDEQRTFVSLYTDIRNRSLRRDISILQQSYNALYYKLDTVAAVDHLSTLAKIKMENNTGELASFYRGICKSIHAGNQCAAACAIQDDINQLVEDTHTSPWQYNSRYGVPIVENKEIGELQL